MRTLALLVLGCTTVALAQTPKTYTPSTTPRPGEETILNARVVSVDRSANRLTVRGVDVKADGGANETFTVAAPAASRLAELRPGMEVLLTLRGTTVVDVKVSAASGGEGGNVIRGGTGGTPSAPAARGRARSGASGTQGGGGTSTGVVVPGAIDPVTGAPVVTGASGTVQPGVTGTAPTTAPTPGMVGIAPGSGTTRPNAQGTFVLQGAA